VSRAYRAFRPDLRAKHLLATLGIKPGQEQANRVLRRALDRPEARAAGDGDDADSARPPLFLALYVLLKDHLASADHVYTAIVQPAERQRDDMTFLDAAMFRAGIEREMARFGHVPDPIPEGSEAEALALFALAYGLLQPDEAVAIVDAVASAGAGFRRFFGLTD
jgi:nucleotide-binding universal stress UspA family protein